MTIAFRDEVNAVAAGAQKLLIDKDLPGDVQQVGSATPFVVATIGPIDLKIGDHVFLTCGAEFTRPMPGDPEGAWTWYRTSQPPPWEGAYAEDHNPAVVQTCIMRSTSPTAAIAESYPAGRRENNLLQYQHHLAIDRAAQDRIAALLDDRYYHFVCRAAASKPGRPDGTFVKVESVQLQVAVLR